jgi:hypothetical protein
VFCGLEADISGLNVYDKSVTKFSLVTTGPEEYNKIKGPIRGFYLDENKILWIASQGGGLIPMIEIQTSMKSSIIMRMILHR